MFSIITSPFTMAAITRSISFYVFVLFAIYILTNANPAIDPNYTTRPSLVITEPITKQPVSYNVSIELSANSTGIHVSWDFYPNAINYHVIHGPTSRPPDREVRIVDGGVNMIWVPSLPNVLYTIEVVARFTDIELIRHLGSEMITTENGVFVTAISDTSVTFWWGVITGIDKYNIIYHQSSDSRPEGRNLHSVSSDKSQYTINGLQANTEYTLRVEGVNDTQNMLYPVSPNMDVVFRTLEADWGVIGLDKSIVIAVSISVIGAVVLMLLIVIVCLIQRKSCQQQDDRNTDNREREASIRQSQIYSDIDDINRNPTEDVIRHTYFNPQMGLSPQSCEHSVQRNNSVDHNSSKLNGSGSPIRDSGYMVPNSPRALPDPGYVEPNSPRRGLPDLNLAVVNSHQADAHYISMLPSSPNKF